MRSSNCAVSDLAVDFAPVPGQIAVAESSAEYTAAQHTAGWVEVLVDCPGAQGLYTYVLPAELLVQAGDILSVPFGAQQVGAVAIRLLEQLPPDLPPLNLRPVSEVVSHAFFPAGYWQLLEQVAIYYRSSLMQVIRVALPPGLLGRSQRRLRLIGLGHPEQATHPAAQQILALLQAQKQGDYSWQYLQRQVRQAQAGLRELLRRGWVESYLATPTAQRPKQRQSVLRVQTEGVELSPRQQEILDLLKQRGGELWLQELLQITQVSSSVLKLLEQKGCLVIQPREMLRLETSPVAADQPKLLTPAQAEVLKALQSVTCYRPVLLHGVTGSGKTEVYLQAIAPLLEQGRSALVLVPEIGLTPQLTDRFRARFGSRVRVYHSGLSAGERYDTWRQMLEPKPQVIIGTRSAVFAPLANLGLIVLDEEHDDSFKQDQPMPCYHARQVAEWRAEAANCPLLLGSATPALETWVNFTAPPMPFSPHPLYLSLPERVQARPLPPIEVIDMRQELHRGNRSIFSGSLQNALKDLIRQGQQGILFIHRRGHSTFVSCRSCGHVMECPHCDVSLTYHQPHPGGRESLHCHYCGYQQSQPANCPACGSPYLKHFGSGTQRVIQELNRELPELRCIRFDSDTTRTKGSHRALLGRFAAGEADLLVGTQMLTKGIDLPQVTLVGVVAADGLLHLADYRAGERAFQTLTQVAGRAGRGEFAGRVILQTYSPEHEAVQAAVRQNYAAFAEAELQPRLGLHYPPYGELLLLRLSGVNEAAVQQTAKKLAKALRRHLAGQGDYELLGPTAAAVARVAHRYRWQVLLKSWGAEPLALPELPELQGYCAAGVSLTVDVDPLHLL
ncbi:MAG: primosomal protein N' [Pegethrix bostrychoides GSE-TBD4-15B]|jgi:primosomal protein N' (replication factor Y)|uniref:Replication restart protein PriA n=1 Tax=Pegethrix bostrychoides GSE-TBD4-15B TaxID=2839662 RepID=A0A951PED2_9CYAN|nr:primosomal protein N' [Pegethrix bostrychoides GSE-TBD4-15B]